MKLFHENSLDVQEDLRIDAPVNLRVAPEEPNEDEDLSYDDDDLGENSEITPLGDDLNDDNINDIKTFGGPLDDDDDLLSDDDDLDVETETYVDDEDEIVDITTSQQNDPDDDDDDLLADDDDDDLLLDDDDEIENPDAIPDTSLTDDDDEVFEDDDLSDDEDLDAGGDRPTTATNAPQTFDTSDSGVSSRQEVRNTGRMVGHEPGIPGGLGSEI
ncbi:hypothetical protein [Arcticibacter tournemirensis]